MREPLPISVDPATTERADALLHAITAGQIDRATLNERLSDLLPDAGIANGAKHVVALGDAHEMFPFEQRITAEGVATYYRVRYPAETLTWVFSLDHDGLINGFSLRRGPTNKIFDVWLRNVTY